LHKLQNFAGYDYTRSISEV